MDLVVLEHNQQLNPAVRGNQNVGNIAVDLLVGQDEIVVGVHFHHLDGMWDLVSDQSTGEDVVSLSIRFGFDSGLRLHQEVVIMTNLSERVVRIL